MATVKDLTKNELALISDVLYCRIQRLKEDLWVNESDEEVCKELQEETDEVRALVKKVDAIRKGMK